MNKLKIDGVEAGLLGEYFEEDEVVEILEGLGTCDDITNGNYRIIRTDMLEEILAKELEDDAYNAGCFSAWFISDLTDLSREAVTALQDNDCYFDIHRAIKNGEGFVCMAEEAISTDGAGHYFSHYDGHEIEIGEYSLFRIN